jgi:hypothetical protein
MRLYRNLATAWTTLLAALDEDRLVVRASRRRRFRSTCASRTPVRLSISASRALVDRELAEVDPSSPNWSITALWSSTNPYAASEPSTIAATTFQNLTGYRMP